jgi:hypothetical protein
MRAGFRTPHPRSLSVKGRGEYPAPFFRGGLPSDRLRRKWWTEHGSTKWINDRAYFDNAVRYVLERQ